MNKVSNAAHLRFDVRNSDLWDEVKSRLMSLPDRRISKDGVVVIKAQSERSLELNKAQALQRLRELIAEASAVQKNRKPTKPTYGSKLRRLEAKGSRSQIKTNRAKVQV